jgi:hypothetical protein
MQIADLKKGTACLVRTKVITRRGEGRVIHSEILLLFYHRSQITDHRSQITDHRFRIADCGLRIADCGLRIADCGFKDLTGMRMADSQASNF